MAGTSGRGCSWRRCDHAMQIAALSGSETRERSSKMTGSGGRTGNRGAMDMITDMAMDTGTTAEARRRVPSRARACAIARERS